MHAWLEAPAHFVLEESACLLVNAYAPGAAVGAGCEMKRAIGREKCHFGLLARGAREWEALWGWCV
eukprot:1158340-Pelagomonas_calceolata.AAC.1